MTVLSILAIVLSIGVIVFCVYTDFQHYEEDKVTLKLIQQHTEIMHYMINCMWMLEQRIKNLEDEIKKGR